VINPRLLFFCEIGGGAIWKQRKNSINSTPKCDAIFYFLNSIIQSIQNEAPDIIEF